MNLCFMIAHSLMLVLSVDSVKEPVDYSGLIFIVDQSTKFKDELTTISNFLNEICRSDINNERKEYLIQYYLEGTKPRVISFRHISKHSDDDFNKLSDVMELKPSYMLLDKILEARQLRISVIFRALIINIKNILSEAIDMCNSKIKLLETNTDSDHSYTIKKYRDFIDCSTELMAKIIPRSLTFKVALIGRSDLNELIFLFLGKFYETGEYSDLLPAMDAYTYNVYMLYITIIKLKDALPRNEYGIIEKDGFWNEKNNINNVKSLISKLTIQLFSYLIKNNNDLLTKMEYCVATSNVYFFNINSTLNFMYLKKVTGIKNYDILDEIEWGIISYVDKILNHDILQIYKKQLVKTKIFLMKTIEKGYLDQTEKERYFNFCNKIDIAILDIEDAVKYGNYDRNALKTSYWIKLVAESNILN